MAVLKEGLGLGRALGGGGWQVDMIDVRRWYVVRG